jgi:hypothetical protein
MDERTMREFLRLHEGQNRMYRLFRDATHGLESGALEQARRLAELRVQVSPVEEAARHWQEQNRLFSGHLDELRQRISFLDGLRPHELALMSFPQQEAMRRMMDLEQTARAVRPPQVDELRILESAIKRVTESDWVRKTLLTEDRLLGVIRGMHTAWFEPSGASSLVENLAKLKTLGGALELPAYGQESSAVVREMLGDWRRISLPEAVYSDWHARSNFYRQAGFDLSLVALPEPAFTESLHVTSVWDSSVFTPVLREAEDTPLGQAASVEGAVRVRMVEVFDAITGFERRVRAFLVSALSRRYGAKWCKQRVPGSVLTSWKMKRKNALAQGQQQLDLIEYADFTDYVQIITRSDNWEELFSAVFINKDDVTVSFQRLYPLRHATMHSREITKEDFVMLLVETRRVTQAIRSVEPTQETEDED